MLARRLLMAGRGSGGFTPSEAEEEDMRVVAFLTRLSNKVIADDTRFPFDKARVMDTAYCTWDGGATDGIVIVQTGWYWIHVDVTTLGTDYGGANNQNWSVAVSRNGVALADTLLYHRHQAGFSQSADAFTTGRPAYLTSGDELFMYFQNTNAANILVESNPTDGPDYTTDTGEGVIGPHLILVKLSGDAPT